MNITIHPAENQDSFVSLALNLFMQAAAEDLLKEKAAADRQHSA